MSIQINGWEHVKCFKCKGHCILYYKLGFDPNESGIIARCDQVEHVKKARPVKPGRSPGSIISDENQRAQNIVRAMKSIGITPATPMPTIPPSTGFFNELCSKVTEALKAPAFPRSHFQCHHVRKALIASKAVDGRPSGSFIAHVLIHLVDTGLLEYVGKSITNIYRVRE